PARLRRAADLYRRPDAAHGKPDLSMDPFAVAHRHGADRCRAHPRFPARAREFALAAVSDVRPRRRWHLPPAGPYSGLSGGDLAARPPMICVLLDHLVGASEQVRRYLQPESFRGLEIDDELQLCRLLNRQIAGFGAL